MDRNNFSRLHYNITVMVALRKESVDRNKVIKIDKILDFPSLSVRRAWIEMIIRKQCRGIFDVALRKESVDRNINMLFQLVHGVGRSP